ncbi:MAG TPA: hypothetical protein VNK52_04980 [Hyphomicrobiaceae bacterium]|nr:hypothetical protein [Hyphomicrobiaceae bacterium]
MQVKTSETPRGSSRSRPVATGTAIMRGGLLFLFCHVLFIGLGMLAYFAD